MNYPMKKDTGRQIGKFVLAYEKEFPSLEEADLVLVGAGRNGEYVQDSMIVLGRMPFATSFILYITGTRITIADLGNICQGQHYRIPMQP